MKIKMPRFVKVTRDKFGVDWVNPLDLFLANEGLGLFRPPKRISYEFCVGCGERSEVIIDYDESNSDDRTFNDDPHDLFELPEGDYMCDKCWALELSAMENDNE